MAFSDYLPAFIANCLRRRQQADAHQTFLQQDFGSHSLQHEEEGRRGQLVSSMSVQARQPTTGTGIILASRNQSTTSTPLLGSSSANTTQNGYLDTTANRLIKFANNEGTSGFMAGCAKAALAFWVMLNIAFFLLIASSEIIYYIISIVQDGSHGLFGFFGPVPEFIATYMIGVGCGFFDSLFTTFTIGNPLKSLESFYGLFVQLGRLVNGSRFSLGFTAIASMMMFTIFWFIWAGSTAGYESLVQGAHPQDGAKKTLNGPFLEFFGDHAYSIGLITTISTILIYLLPFIKIIVNSTFDFKGFLNYPWEVQKTWLKAAITSPPVLLTMIAGPVARGIMGEGLGKLLTVYLKKDWWFSSMFGGNTLTFALLVAISGFVLGLATTLSQLGRLGGPAVGVHPITSSIGDADDPVTHQGKSLVLLEAQNTKPDPSDHSTSCARIGRAVTNVIFPDDAKEMKDLIAAGGIKKFFAYLIKFSAFCQLINRMAVLDSVMAGGRVITGKGGTKVKDAILNFLIHLALMIPGLGYGKSMSTGNEAALAEVLADESSERPAPTEKQTNPTSTHFFATTSEQANIIRLVPERELGSRNHHNIESPITAEEREQAMGNGVKCCL